MRKTIFRLTTLFAIIASDNAQAQFKVEPDKNNVVSSQLEGHWKFDVELSKRLTGKLKPTFPGYNISFRSDSTFAAKIPAKYNTTRLAKMRIFMAGEMTFIYDGKDRKHLFILIQNRGNPHVVWFRERDGDPLGDAESFNVMLAVAKDRANDLLLIGGDFNNQPFSAYSRVKKTQ